MPATDDPRLDIWDEAVYSRVSYALAQASPVGTDLHGQLQRVMSDARDSAGRSSHRLLPLAIYGALTGDPYPAVPVCVISCLWWAGAELLDDHADQPDSAQSGSQLLAGIACLSAVPQLFIESLPLSDAVRARWSVELSRSSVRAAEGQLGDLARDQDALTWRRVMVTYGAKTGAAYERDAAMTAQLAGLDEEQTNGWRAFGRLFGVLRQMSNDNVPDAPELDEDLANGTPTLLLAHALAAAEPDTRQQILTLREAARKDYDARRSLRRLLNGPNLQHGYRRRLLGLRREAHGLLELLAAPSEHRDQILSWIDASVATAARAADEHLIEASLG